MFPLLKTRLRRKLLVYFFTHSDENYYVRELSSLIDEDAGNLSRELRRLEEEGLYTSFLRGKEKFYALNKSYPLFKEIKKIIFKTEGIEGSLKNLVSKYKGISLALLYGSYAKNKEKKASDIDLLLVGKFPHSKFTSDIRQLEGKFNREINFSFYSQEEFKQKQLERGGFLNIVLKDKTIILKGKLNVR